MSLGTDNLYRVANILQRVELELAEAASLVGTAIFLESSGTTPDPLGTSWPTLQTAIMTERANVIALAASVQFTPVDE